MMKKLIVIGLFIVAINSIAAPSFGADVGYNATVLSGQSTSVQSVNGIFGAIIVSQTGIIPNSVVLNNTGDMNATVSARIPNNISDYHGLINNTNVLGASNFSLAKNGTSSWTALLDSGTDVTVVTAQYGTLTALDARLYVPPSQPAGVYSGTVVLTFATEV